MVCTYKFRSTIFFRRPYYELVLLAQQTRDNTDPTCVISVDCARGFAPGVLRSYTG